jgi:protein SCO1/2
VTTQRPVRRPLRSGRVMSHLSLALLLLTVAACSASPESGDAVETPAATTEAAPAVLIPAPDLAGVTLHNQNNEAVVFEDLRGKPTLLTFLYTRCPMPEMCPATMLRLQEVQKALSLEDRGEVRIVAVSFDPLDTPEVLAEYGETWEVDSSFWSLLTGDAESVQKVAGSYGAWYEKADGEVYDHTMVTLVLLPDGSVHEIMTGSAWDSANVTETLLSLVGTGTSPP